MTKDNIFDGPSRLEFKTWKEAREYFVNSVLLQSDHKIAELMQEWAEEEEIEIIEARELQESDAYDLATSHAQ